MFELKPLPDTLKYAYLDEKKIYPVIISANLSEHEEERLLKTLNKHHAAIGYTLDDLKGISPTLCQHKINLEEDAKPVRDHQRWLNPKMKEVVRKEILLSPFYTGMHLSVSVLTAASLSRSTTLAWWERRGCVLCCEGEVRHVVLLVSIAGKGGR